VNQGSEQPDIRWLKDTKGISAASHNSWVSELSYTIAAEFDYYIKNLLLLGINDRKRQKT
tara:strand:- start:166 stop:345 length:180 start_codon:yes stop_codon:yes gene_type:complete